jgi:hypothetical protein
MVLMMLFGCGDVNGLLGMLLYWAVGEGVFEVV